MSTRGQKKHISPDISSYQNDPHSNIIGQYSLSCSIFVSTDSWRNSSSVLNGYLIIFSPIGRKAASRHQLFAASYNKCDDVPQEAKKLIRAAELQFFFSVGFSLQETFLHIACGHLLFIYI